MDYDESIEKLEKNKFLKFGTLKKIIANVQMCFSNEPNVVRTTSNMKIVIVGDIHGQFGDLLKILRTFGNVKDTKYIFLGDYVDRGYKSVEVITYLYLIKLKYPKNIILLRGNHECRAVSQIDFLRECERKYGFGSVLWRSFNNSFDYLPIATIIDEKYFCVHGGLSPSINTVKQVTQIHRKREVPQFGEFCDLLWSDPDERIEKWSPSERGAGFMFGSRIVKDFLHLNKLKILIRAHQICDYGYKYSFKEPNQCLTVFSAPNYCYRLGNEAAVIEYENDKLKPIKFKESEQQKVEIKDSGKSLYFL